MWSVPKGESTLRKLDLSHHDADVVIAVSMAKEEEVAVININGEGAAERVEVKVDKGPNKTRVSVDGKLKLIIPSDVLRPRGVYAVSIRPKDIYFATGGRKVFQIGRPASWKTTKTWISAQFALKSGVAKGKLFILAKKSNWTSPAAPPPPGESRHGGNKKGSFSTLVGGSVSAFVVLLAMAVVAMVIISRRKSSRTHSGPLSTVRMGELDRSDGDGDSGAVDGYGEYDADGIWPEKKPEEEEEDGCAVRYEDLVENAYYDGGVKPKGVTVAVVETRALEENAYYEASENPLKDADLVENAYYDGADLNPSTVAVVETLALEDNAYYEASDEREAGRLRVASADLEDNEFYERSENASRNSNCSEARN